MGRLQYWDEIVKEYPDRWVALCDYNMTGPTIDSAVVCAVCTDKERLEKEKELDLEHVSFIWRRTTDVEGAYIL